MVIFPNAKINIGLTITEKRPDGFHNIETCFYPVQWNDVLEIVSSKKMEINITGINIPGDPKENLVYKAYELLKKDFDLPPVKMHLHKVVPIGAGLGGGSADAAFAVKALAEMFNLIFEPDLLKIYTSKLGSDCSFFIDNQPSMAYGKGDELEPIDLNLSEKFIFIVYPNIHVPTKEAYAGIKPGHSPYNLQQSLQNNSISEWKEIIRNDFEGSVFIKYPEIRNIKEKLYELGALYAAMSGSGSAVFGIFDEYLPVKEHFKEGYIIWSNADDELS